MIAIWLKEVYSFPKLYKFYLQISFFNSCHDDVCFADLSLTCSVIGDSDHFTVPTVIIGSDQVLTLNLNLTNQMDAAYDVEFDVTFPNSVYFIQSLPFSKKVRDKTCLVFKNLSHNFSSC